MSSTILLTYTGTAKDRFDRDYYCSKHLPQVAAAWEPYGLVSLRTFFPAVEENQPGIVAICECVFQSEDAVGAAFSSPNTAGLVADLVNFTDLPLARARMVDFPL